MKHPLASLMQSRWFYTMAATTLTSAFWWSGVSKLFDFTGTLAEMAHFGLQPAVLFAVLTIALQLIGSALIITASRWAFWGAGALIAFTLATIPMAHRFWEIQGLVGMLEKALVMDHVSVIGGLLLASALAQMHHHQHDGDNALHPALSACFHRTPKPQPSDASPQAADGCQQRTAPASSVAYSQFLHSDAAAAAAVHRHLHGNRPPFHGHGR